MMKDGAKILAVDALSAHRADEDAILFALGLALSHAGFDAFAQVDGEAVICHRIDITAACEFHASYVGEIYGSPFPHREQSLKAENISGIFCAAASSCVERHIALPMRPAFQTPQY
ncbi:MAG: hypothetical protein QM759_08245 [Terricaulis sp.]